MARGCFSARHRSSASLAAVFSALLTTIDRLMPEQARTWDAAFRRLLSEHVFPQVFGALGPQHVVAVPPPDPAVAHSRAVQVARADIVKIVGTTSCGRTQEGSG